MTDMNIAYKPDALYPEYKTISKEPSGEHMTNEKRIATECPAPATVLTEEHWMPDEQAAFSAWVIREFPNESSQGLISLGSAFKRGQAFALAHAGVTAEPAEVLTLPKAIMSIEVDPRQSDEYKRGHRDARHSAADLVLEFADKLVALAQVPAAEVRAAALEEVAKLIDKKVEAYDHEHGSYDHTTGVTEYPGNGEEWVCEMEELAEEIRALEGQSTADSGSTLKGSNDE